MPREGASPSAAWWQGRRGWPVGNSFAGIVRAAAKHEPNVGWHNCCCCPAKNPNCPPGARAFCLPPRPPANLQEDDDTVNLLNDLWDLTTHPRFKVGCALQPGCKVPGGTLAGTWHGRWHAAWQRAWRCAKVCDRTAAGKGEPISATTSTGICEPAPLLPLAGSVQGVSGRAGAGREAGGGGPRLPAARQEHGLLLR